MAEHDNPLRDAAVQEIGWLKVVFTLLAAAVGSVVAWVWTHFYQAQSWQLVVAVTSVYTGVAVMALVATRIDRCISIVRHQS